MLVPVQRDVVPLVVVEARGGAPRAPGCGGDAGGQVGQLAALELAPRKRRQVEQSPTSMQVAGTSGTIVESAAVKRAQRPSGELLCSRRGRRRWRCGSGGEGVQAEEAGRVGDADRRSSGRAETELRRASAYGRSEPRTITSIRAPASVRHRPPARTTTSRQRGPGRRAEPPPRAASRSWWRGARPAPAAKQTRSVGASCRPTTWNAHQAATSWSTYPTTGAHQPGTSRRCRLRARVDEHRHVELARTARNTGADAPNPCGVNHVGGGELHADEAGAGAERQLAEVGLDRSTRRPRRGTAPAARALSRWYAARSADRRLASTRCRAGWTG